jgi:hypothetical protein
MGFNYRSVFLSFKFEIKGSEFLTSQSNLNGLWLLILKLFWYVYLTKAFFESLSDFKVNV